MLRRCRREGSIRAGFLLVVALGMLGLMAAVAGGIQPYEGYEAAVASDGPLAQFRFDDAAGSDTLTDSVGSFTASNSGIVLGGEGPFGGSRSGSLGGEAFATPPSGPLEGAGAFTAEAWVDWTGGTSFKQPIFDFGSSSTNYMYLTPASALSGHKLLFEIHTAGGTVAQVTAPELTAKAWKYVAVSETSSGTLTLYVNGEQVGQATGETIAPAALGSTPSGYLGKSLVSGDPDFKGSLSNVAFYGKALSAERIKAHYDAAELPVNTAAPTISGTVKDGSTLTAKAGSWSGLTPFTFAYQWTRCNSAGAECVQIVSVPETKATETKYTLAHEDVGKTLRINVTATNSAGEGSATSAQTAVVAAVKPSNKTLPAISGEAKVGQLLSVSEGSWEGTPPTSYAYQWETCNSAGKSCKHITGATTSSYRVLASQVGDTLRAIVTAENSAGSASATSEATAVVAPGAPANIVAPAISGTARDGQTLTASTGSWAGSEPISYAYQWQSCNGKGESCTNIPGASGSSYMLTPSNVGSTLDVVVTASNSVGSTPATSQATAVVAAIPPANTAAPTITGTATDGQNLTASTGSWSGTPPLSYSYQWRSCNAKGEGCPNIPGATNSTYTLTHGDVGTTLRVAVTAKNAGGEATSSSAASAVVAPLAPSNVEAPAISGTAEEGETLKASTGTWSGTPPLEYAHRWERCNSKGECSAIEGALASSYTLRQEDVGSTIGVSVTAKNAAGEALSAFTRSAVVKARPPANTAAPTISGNAQEGQTLTVSTGSWSGTSPLTYTYQWQRCYGAETSCTNLTGATEQSYVAGPESVGTTPRVVVTATNAAGSASSVSQLADVVASQPPSNVEPPAISGIAREGEVLSASAGEWSGSEPLVYAYQWESCNALGESCMAIAGATSSTHLLGPGEAGGTIEVAVTATNPVTSVSSTSRATASIAPGPFYVMQLGQGNFQRPGGVAADGNGNIFVLDTAGDRIVEFNHAGEYTREFGSAGSEDGQLNKPDGIAVAVSGDVWVADTGNNRVEEFAADGEYLSSFAAAERPEGIAVGANGSVWVSAGGHGGLQQFGENGEFVRDVGSSGEGELGQPEGLAADAQGDVWVTDWSRSRVEEFNEAGEFLRRFGEVGVGNGQLKNPYGIAVDSHGDVWVGDVSNDRVEEFGENGEYLSQFGSKGSGVGQLRLSFPMGLAVDREEDIWVADPSNDRVEEWMAPPAAPSNTTPPEVSGEAVAGQTLSAGNGVWANAPQRYGYQWQSCNTAGGECTDIPGAIGDSYLLGSSSVGATVRVLVSAFNAGGATTTESSATSVVAAATPLANTTAPAISGVAQDGQALRANTGTWSGTPAFSYAYQWESCDPTGGECAPIEAATGSEYALTDGDVGTTLRVVVSATNDAGSAQATSAESVEVLSEPPSELEAPTISGTPDEHQVLHANRGAWAGTERQFSYQWESCSSSGTECAPIVGATQPEYDLGEGDVATTLRVRVGVVSTQGALTDVSDTTPVVGLAGAVASAVAPEVSGTLGVGHTLTASPGGWSGHVLSYTYQWQGCNRFGQACTNIEGATGASYTLLAGEAGSTLRAQVTASGEKQSVSRVSDATQPVASSGSPVVEQPPLLEGGTLQGQTLTVAAGQWSGEGSISYAFQWERCDEAGACTAVEGATASSYTLTEVDVGATMRALVTATDAGGSSIAVSAASATIDPETLLSFSSPSISGTAELGEELGAEPGIWSGSGPVSYSYQWQRCSPTGGECVSIEGADEQAYAIAGADLGATLRVDVTVTGPLGSESALSPATVATPSGEATVEQAEESAQRLDPAVLAPSSAATLEGQTVAPVLVDREQLSSEKTLTSSSISKEDPGEFAVNTTDGELSVKPLETSPHATTLPTLVNGAVALFANTWPATDTIVRPDALGATMLLQMRSHEAPRSCSWEVGLGAGEQLRQLPDGSVAVVSVSEEPLGEPEASREPEPHESGEPLPETPTEQAEREHREAEPETEARVEPPPPAPTSSTQAAEVPPGQLEPQNTQAQYEDATAAMRSAETATGDLVLMVIKPPDVLDAHGHAVSASLSVIANTITLTVKPTEAIIFPILAELTVAAPSDKASAERDPFEYGLADNKAATFENQDALRLTEEPAPLHIQTARRVVPWDVFTRPTELAEVKAWVAAVEAEPHRLQPYITIEADTKKVEATHQPEKLSVRTYRAKVKQIIRKFDKQVKYWGAWNEPDHEPYLVPRERAAAYWQAAESVVLELGCNCTVIAGEFQQYPSEEAEYERDYSNDLLKYEPEAWSASRKMWKIHEQIWKRHRIPTIWGFHDYHDVVNFTSAGASEFQAFTSHGRLGRPKVWISEAGIELHNGHEAIAALIRENDEQFELEQQTRAANTFLALRDAKAPHEKMPRIQRVYYYSFNAPTPAETAKKAQAFDSGLEDAPILRPAYCFLAYAGHECPPTVETLSLPSTGSGDPLQASVNTHGYSTTVEMIVSGGGCGGGDFCSPPFEETLTLPEPVGADVFHPITVSFPQKQSCPGTLRYRAVAHNKGGPAAGATLERVIGCV